MSSSKLLEIEVVDWIRGSGSSASAFSTGALRISAGADNEVLTEVEDTIACTVRPHVYLPVSELAEWLLINWWRLRWEPRPENPSGSWLDAHSVAAIGGGNAWPGLEFSSDGDYIHLRMEAEAHTDAAGIRYLTSASLDIPASSFERAVDRFLAQVQERASASRDTSSTIQELADELRRERESTELARVCRWQAIAGVDPGAAPKEWIEAVARLQSNVGASGAEECLAILGQVTGGLDGVSQELDAMRASETCVDLGFKNDVSDRPVLGSEPPWELAERAALGFRAKLGLQGPLEDSAFQDLLGVRFPLPRPAAGSAAVFGAMVEDGWPDRGRTVVRSPRVVSQRFELARVIGCALLDRDDALLPVTNSHTALQKYERAFAAEFLCPWVELDAFTDDRGLDNETIDDAADHFRVSPLLVTSSLVNKRKVPRHRLFRQW